jgi:tetratricopeptide (TPR) repeat protein
MPLRWLAAIAPYNADVWSRALAPLQQAGPEWAPLSLDPQATRVEVLRGVAYLLAFLVALRIARRRDGVGFLSAAIIVTAIVVAIAALLHPAFGAKRLYGVYEPTHGIAARHFAPFLNPNNLAGYLTLAFCLSLAALLAPEPRVPRSILAGTVVLLAGVQLWVASRAGVITMVLGACLVLFLSGASRTRAYAAATKFALLAGLAMAAGTAVLVLSASDEASKELFDTDISKARMFLEMTQGLPRMALFGCGRGAFESTFPAFRTEPGYTTYSHPENVIAQWIVEWGLPVGVSGLAAVAFGLRPQVVLARSATAIGAWAGIVAVGLQNLVDLGTEIPGLMLACVVCAAIVAAGTHGGDSKWRVGRWARRPRYVALGAAAAGVVALLATVRSLRFGLSDDQNAMYHAAIDDHISASAMRTLAGAAMLRHPSEPYLPFVVALRAAREHDDNPIPWIGATLERAKVYGPAHFVLAEVVTSRSPSQARLEYRLAMEQSPELIAGVMREAPRVVGSYFDATELIPQGPMAGTVSEDLVQAIGDRLPATRVRLDQDILARTTRGLGPARRSALDAVEDLEAGGGTPWCEGLSRDGCVRGALAKATSVKQIEPERCDGFALHARARVASEDAAGGLAELENAANEVTDRLPCLQQLVTLNERMHNEASAEATLDKIALVGCSSSELECSRNLIWVAREYEGMAKPLKALAAYRRAMEQVPDDALLARVAELEARAGLHTEAGRDYEQLARRHPDDARWARQALAEHEAAMRGIQSL